MALNTSIPLRSSIVSTAASSTVCSGEPRLTRLDMDPWKLCAQPVEERVFVEVTPAEAARIRQTLALRASIGASPLSQAQLSVEAMMMAGEENSDPQQLLRRLRGAGTGPSTSLRPALTIQPLHPPDAVNVRSLSARSTPISTAMSLSSSSPDKAQRRPLEEESCPRLINESPCPPLVGSTSARRPLPLLPFPISSPNTPRHLRLLSCLDREGRRQVQIVVPPPSLVGNDTTPSGPSLSPDTEEEDRITYPCSQLPEIIQVSPTSSLTPPLGFSSTVVPLALDLSGRVLPELTARGVAPAMEGEVEPPLPTRQSTSALSNVTDPPRYSTHRQVLSLSVPTSPASSSLSTEDSGYADAIYRSWYGAEELPRRSAMERDVFGVPPPMQGRVLGIVEKVECRMRVMEDYWQRKTGDSFTRSRNDRYIPPRLPFARGATPYNFIIYDPPPFHRHLQRPFSAQQQIEGFMAKRQVKIGGRLVATLTPPFDSLARPGADLFDEYLSWSGSCLFDHRFDDRVVEARLRRGKCWNCGCLHPHSIEMCRHIHEAARQAVEYSDGWCWLAGAGMGIRCYTSVLDKARSVPHIYANALAGVRFLFVSIPDVVMEARAEFGLCLICGWIHDRSFNECLTINERQRETIDEDRKECERLLEGV